MMNDDPNAARGLMVTAKRESWAALVRHGEDESEAIVGVWRSDPNERLYIPPNDD